MSIDIIKKTIWHKVLILLTVLLIINTIRQVITKIDIDRRIGVREKRVAALMDKNKELSEVYRQVQSEEYLKQEARDKLGLGPPGETYLGDAPALGNSREVYDGLVDPKEPANWQKWAWLLVK